MNMGSKFLTLNEYFHSFECFETRHEMLISKTINFSHVLITNTMCPFDPSVLYLVLFLAFFL